MRNSVPTQVEDAESRIDRLKSGRAPRRLESCCHDAARLGQVRFGGDMFGWAMPEGLLRDAPAYAPRPRELADLELLLNGALTPLTGFHTRADLASIAQSARLADGTPWPVRITLEAPAKLVEEFD